VAPTFVPGLQLAREFYAAKVRPLLEGQFPGLRYAAALIGQGSEVAGFDTERSTDHDWGPRLQIFLSDSDAGRHAATITETLTRSLPGDLPRIPGRLPRHQGARRRRPAPRRGHWAGRLARLLAGVRPAAGGHRDGLAGRPGAAAGGVHHRGGLPRRARRADPRPRRPGLVSPRPAPACWPASGSASARRKPSPDGAPRPATTSARASSPRAWPAT
jgi:hypothetical protein